MAKKSSEEQLDALFKSIEITKRDAEFNTDNPPNHILNPIKMNFLKAGYLTFDPKSTFDKIISIESNRDILKKDLKYIISLILTMPPAVNVITLLAAVLKKYKIDLNENPIKNSLSVPEIIMVFPDIAYNVVKRNEYAVRSQMELRMLNIYKNVKISHLNIGILGLLPKGKKYGGFVKALIHIDMNLTSNFSEEHFALCRILYHSLITPHEKREKWFAKLEIKESDCMLWNKIFDGYFPEHADIYKYFGQIA